MTNNIWAVKRNRLGAQWLPEFKDIVTEEEVIKETPKGYRVTVGYSKDGYVMLHDKYLFFTTPQAAYAHCAEAITSNIVVYRERLERALKLEAQLYDAARK